MLHSLGETLLGQVIRIESNNTMMVAYINKEGGFTPRFKLRDGALVRMGNSDEHPAAGGSSARS